MTQQDDLGFLLEVIAPQSAIMAHGPCYIVKDGVTISYIKENNQAHVTLQNVAEIKLAWAGTFHTKNILQYWEEDIYHPLLEVDDWVCVTVTRYTENIEYVMQLDIYAPREAVLLQYGQPTEANPTGLFRLTPFIRPIVNENGVTTKHYVNTPPLGSYEIRGQEVSYIWLREINKRRIINDK